MTDKEIEDNISYLINLDAIISIKTHLYKEDDIIDISKLNSLNSSIEERNKIYEELEKNGITRDKVEDLRYQLEKTKFEKYRRKIK